MYDIVPLSRIDPAAVEALLDRAFGPERRARTAYRIRAGGEPFAALSFAAIDGDTLHGTIQCWPIAFEGDDGVTMPLVMVGPVAVEPACQGSGVGRLLVDQAIAAANLSGEDRALMLIGDPDYYGRFFGFTADRTADWRVPGPVERHRLLARGDLVPAGAGALTARMDALA